MDNKNIVIFGGGTVFHVRNHLALCAPAYGHTAKRLAELCAEILPKFSVELKLTKMAGGPLLETNEDIATVCRALVRDDTTKVVIMSAALCDYEGDVIEGNSWYRPGAWAKNGAPDFKYQASEKVGKYSERLKTSDGDQALWLTPADKIIGNIRKERKDIFLVGFKTTCGATEDEQYIAGLNLCKKASCNLVFCNDTKTRLNLIATPEEARYHVTKDRDEALKGLLRMVYHRTHLTFTRSTVIGGTPISWDSEEVPESLRTVVDYCIKQNAYKPFNGATAGHFAVKVKSNEFLTSIRKTNFNKLSEIGLVRVVTDGPDNVIAYGAKPSVGGQSQRIVFEKHPDLDCIVHFHCPIKPGSEIPTVSQYEFECGSHQCGSNTANGLKQFGNVWAINLENHGPNLVFNRNTDPQEVIALIENNFDLSQKTGGFVSVNSTKDDAVKILG